MRIHTASHAYSGSIFADAPRNVYWEVTIACDLACKHCRAHAQPERHPEELTTEDGKALIEDIKSLGSLLILTGGDPMKRPDLFELIDYGRSLHLPMAITPSATPTLTRDVVMRFAQAGLTALGLSLDAPTAEVHDAFRGVPGTFARSVEALEWAREAGIPVQVNTTVTTETLPYLPELYRLLCDHADAVRRWSLFLLVPVGRGVSLGIPSANDVEELFAWVYDAAKTAPFHIGTVEAPHYRRYWLQRQLQDGVPLEALVAKGRRNGLGIRDGNGVVFVSHLGDVTPAGFLPIRIGNVRETKLSDLYRGAPLMVDLRDADRLEGKCGRCDYRWACGGSRARAYGMTGNAMGSDPFCAYDPSAATRELNR